MRRYQGETLPADCRIALISNDALGNYVVITPLVQTLRLRYPEAQLHYFGGQRTAELWEKEALFDRAFPLFGTAPDQASKWLDEPYDWVINVDQLPWAQSFAAMAADGVGLVTGPCLSEDGRAPLAHSSDLVGQLWNDPDWTSETLTIRFPFLRSGFIGELFCRLTYFGGDIPPYRVSQVTPSITVPDVLISMSASLPEKLWPLNHWVELTQNLLNRGLTIGLLGANSANQRKFWQGSQVEDDLLETLPIDDLRGQFTLSEVVGALSQCRQVITLDNGILHLAAATNTPTVGLFRHGIHRLWNPPASNVTCLHPAEFDSVASIPVPTVLDRCRV